jgi:hypothetical protein
LCCSCIADIDLNGNCLAALFGNLLSDALCSREVDVAHYD